MMHRTWLWGKIGIFILLCGFIAVSGNNLFKVNSNTQHSMPVTITKSNAGEYKKYTNTPESIVLYFFASKIRNDEKWKDVLPPENKRSVRLSKTLKEYEDWEFVKITLLEKTEKENQTCWVKVFMEIKINGKMESGKDDVTLSLLNNKWVITSLPG